MQCPVHFKLPLRSAAVTRSFEGAADSIGRRLRPRNYVGPAQREQAMESDVLLLDLMEAGLANASMLGAGYGRIAMHVTVEGPEVKQEAVQACLALMQQRHPYLRRAVERTPLGLAFVPFDGPIPFFFREFREGGSFEDLWNDIEARPLRPGDALGRVHVIPSRDGGALTDFIFELEHAISDGASLIAFCGEFLTELSVYVETGKTGSVKARPLTASMNARCAAEVGGRSQAFTRASRRLLGILWRVRKQLPLGLARRKDCRHTECRTHVARATLTREETERLARIARAEKASLGTALGGAFTLAVGARTAAAEDRHETRHFNISVSASLRHRYAGNSVADGDLGIHVTGIDTPMYFPRTLGNEASDLWEAARVVRTGLIDGMSEGQDAQWLVSFMAGIAMVLPLFVPQANLMCSMLLTDCSRYALPPRFGTYEAKDMRPLVNGLALGYPFIIVTPTPERGLLLSVFAPVPSFRQEDVDALAHGAAERIREALQAYSEPERQLQHDAPAPRSALRAAS